MTTAGRAARRALVVAGLALGLAVVITVASLPGPSAAPDGPPGHEIGVASPTGPTDGRRGHTAGEEAAADDAREEEATEGEDGVAETFEVFTTRNPFAPVIDLSSDDPGDPSGGSPPDGGAPAGDGPEPAPGGDPGADPGTGTDPGARHAPPPGYRNRVALMDVFPDEDGRVVANVRVNDTVWKVGEGDRFADTFSVVSLQDSCGRFLYGDDGFRLCLGDELLK